MSIEPSETKSVKMTSGQTFTIENQVHLPFKIGNRKFSETFLILPTTNLIILGNPFFKAHDMKISPKDGLLQFPELTLQLNEIKPINGPRQKPRAKKFSQQNVTELNHINK